MPGNVRTSAMSEMSNTASEEVEAAAAAAAPKKKRNPPGNPDPAAEVVALSPRALLATNRYVCEVCHKGFQRDQNLQLHRRGHNLPWKLKQRGSNEVKKRVYVCPETGCPHHDRSRALGDLTGIKKHYSRKHGEKKWKCEKCSKKYAVQSDWKAHSKICGTKEYCCDCGTIFSRKDSFITHRAFCDALAEENYRVNHGLAGNFHHSQAQDMFPKIDCKMATLDSEQNTNNPLDSMTLNPMAIPDILSSNSSFRVSESMPISSSFMSATALLQKASEMGARDSDEYFSPLILRGISDFSNTSKTAGFIPKNESRYVHSYAKEASSETGNVRLVSSSVGVSSYVRTQTSSKRNDEVNLISGFRTKGGESAERKNGRMTQDFLGLGASGSAGNSSYNEDEMYSYHQMSNEPVILGKNLWDY